MKQIFIVLIIQLLSAIAISTHATTNQVVIHCTKAGTLKVPHEAYAASRLKVTGQINAEDFRVLKDVTISVTTELDLSDANIEAYTGTNGCYLELMSDWFVGDPEVVEYPADYLPIDCFSIELDNSLHKWREPSGSLRTVILPTSLKGVMRRTLNDQPRLKKISIADGAALKVENDVALYSSDGTVLYNLLPSFHGHLNMPDRLTTIADEALKNASPASLKFNSRTEVKLGDGNSSFNCAYITSPIPEYYSSLFEGVDCFEKLNGISLTCTGGDLIDKVADLGLGRGDLRDLTISGYLTHDELEWLMKLPNLHRLDLHDANGIPLDNIGSNSLTDFVFPASVSDTRYLTINAPHLQGEIFVSEGTYFIQCLSSALSRVTLPATLGDFCWVDNFYRQPIEYLDMSRCKEVASIESMDECPFLETLLLPPYLTKLANVKSPLKQISLPSKLKTIESCGKWEVEELILPASLEKFYLGSAPFLKKIDASACTRLSDFAGLYHAPILEELDLSGTAIKSLGLFDANTHIGDAPQQASSNPAQSRIVVSGSIHVPGLCGIKHIKLPSSITSFSGISYCDRLETLDMSGCEQLEYIQIGHNCNNLHTVKLPRTTKEITGLNNCPALRSLTIGAETPPVITDGLNGGLSGVTLTVPNGRCNIYRLTEKWENAAEILEGGYNVSISPSSSNDIVTGAGLYQPGTTVKLSAKVIPGNENNMLIPRAWWIDGNYTDGAEPSFTMPEHDVTCSVMYDTEKNNPDLQITLHATKDTQITAWNEFDGNYMFSCGDVYLDGVKMSVGGDFHTKDGNWDLTAGEHIVSVYGCNGALSLGKDRETFRPQEGFEVRSIIMTEDCQVRGLEFGCVNIESLTLPASSNLRNLNICSGHLGRLDTREAHLLQCLVVEDCGMRSLQLDEKPELWQLSVNGNNLTSLDLGGCPVLENFNYGNNLFEIDTLDETGCFDLSILTEYGLDLSKIISISKQMDGTKIRFGNTDGSVDNNPVTYTYNAGGGYELEFKLQCTASSWSGIEEVDNEKSGRVKAEGCYIIAEGFTQPLHIYSIEGAIIATLTSDGKVRVPASGIYIAKSGAYVKKLIIRG